MIKHAIPPQSGWYWTEFSAINETCGPIVVHISVLNSRDIYVRWQSYTLLPSEFVGFWGPIECPPEIGEEHT
jgi:hypothetical protein